MAFETFPNEFLTQCVSKENRKIKMFCESMCHYYLNNDHKLVICRLYYFYLLLFNQIFKFLNCCMNSIERGGKKEKGEIKKC